MNRLQRPWRLWVAATLGVLSLAAVVIVVSYRDTYTNWPWDGLPRRLDVCGRTYERADRIVEERKAAVTEVPLHAVVRAPPLVGHRVYTEFTRAQSERRARRQEGCGTGVVLRTGEDRYVMYGLLGGI